MAESEVKTVSVKMSPAFYDWLRERAKSESRSIPSLIEKALKTDAASDNYKPAPERSVR